MRFAYALAVCALTATASFAQYGNLTYNFFGPAGTQTIAFPTAVTSATNVTFGSALTNVATVNQIRTRQWAAQSSADTNSYYGWSLVTAQEISIPNVRVNTTIGSVGPTTLELRSSLDNFTAALGTQTISLNSVTPLTYTLPSATFGNLPGGTNLTFRLYGYNAANNGANSQLGFLSTSASDFGVIVPTAAPVPEPVSVLGVTAPGLAAGGLVRRKVFARS